MTFAFGNYIYDYSIGDAIAPCLSYWRGRGLVQVTAAVKTTGSYTLTCDECSTSAPSLKRDET